jgi:L-threonylcarbamoyladenylate synthase
VERGKDIERAAAVLAAGGLVAFPTETVYGLGADASSDAAVAKIFAAKGRPTGHPLIVHLAPEAQLDDWAIEVPDVARRLVTVAWPGPLTIILNKSPRVAAGTTGGAETVGLRVPAHPVAQALLRAFGGGVAAPSANRFGAVSPTTADHVAHDLADRIDYLLDGGACEVGVESTIVDLSGWSTRGATLLRPGGMARAAIEAVTGPLAAGTAASPAAPGTLESHYAPRALVIAVEPHELALVLPTVRANAHVSEHRVGVLAPPSVTTGLPEDVVVRALPEDVAGMARDLYAALRELDETGVDVVVAALPPAIGLGEAVGDRLLRAAGPRRKS